MCGCAESQDRRGYVGAVVSTRARALSATSDSVERRRANDAAAPRSACVLSALLVSHELSAGCLSRRHSSQLRFSIVFLSNVEGLYTTLEDKIAAMQILFDVRSAPVEVLDWLAGWFGVALDPSWDEARRRMFISHAIDFFQYRGTIRGLTMALHLALDDCADENIFNQSVALQISVEPIRIVERYLTRTLPGVIFGDPSEATGPRAGVLTSSWQPAQGRANLNQRYAEVLGRPRSSALQFPCRRRSGKRDLETVFQRRSGSFPRQLPNTQRGKLFCKVDT